MSEGSFQLPVLGGFAFLLRCTVEKIHVASGSCFDDVLWFRSDIFLITRSQGKIETPFLRNFVCGEGLLILDVSACAVSAHVQPGSSWIPITLSLE